MKVVKGSGGNLKSIDDLLDEANSLIEDAEQKLETDFSGSTALFQQGISNLCKAYLLANDQDAQGDLKTLFFQCKQINPEFGYIEEELEYFLAPDPVGTDKEITCDAANEIWDFFLSVMPEEFE
jgi:hypothetical protein